MVTAPCDARAVATEPPPSRWSLPDPAAASDDLVAVGADLEPGTVLAAYRNGLFPMRVSRHGPLGWWSPDPRGIIPLDGLRVSRSLWRSYRRYTVTVNTAFLDVVRACADARRPAGWIDESFVSAYTQLHRLGWAHSVETWADGELVGGLYGVAVGALFAGESMFHRSTDASKVALVGLVERLRDAGATLLDVQWTTPHLCSLGAVDIARGAYLELLRDAVERPALRLDT